MYDNLDDLLHKKRLEAIGVKIEGNNKQQKKSEECDYFHELCHGKIDVNKESSEAIGKHENFIDVVDRLICQFPFLNIKKFNECYLEGILNNEIFKAFHFSNSNDLKECIKKKNLDLPPKRSKKDWGTDSNNWTRRENSRKFQKNYEYIKKECEFFENELNDLYNYNFARSMLLCCMLDGKIDVNEMETGVEEINLDNGFNFKNSTLENKYFAPWELSVDEYLDELVTKHPMAKDGSKATDTVKLEQIRKSITEEEMKVIKEFRDVKQKWKKFYSEIFPKIIKENGESLKTEFHNKGIIGFEGGGYRFDQTYKDVEDGIYSIIENAYEGITFHELITKLKEEYPIVSFIPIFGLIAESLEGFRKKGRIRPVGQGGHSGIVGNKYYTIANLSANKKLLKQGRKFFGRKNDDPFKEIEDLRYLDKGDFSDEDDQVTRLAGMVLAGTQNLIAPNEKHEEFDFAVDMSNFSPTEEEMKIIQEIDFKLNPTSEIIHIKVMINDEIETDNIELFQKVLPKNEQLVIISFKKVSEGVRNILPKDNSIQIMGKNAIKLWLDITPILPSRKGAVCKIMDGPYSSNIARMNNVNYETGDAEVELIPSGDEVTTYVGFLQEINLHDDSVVDDFSIMSQNYYDFLKILGDNGDTEKMPLALFFSHEFTSLISINNKIANWDLEREQKLHIRCPDSVFRSQEEAEKNVHKPWTSECEITPNGKDFESMFYCRCDYFKDNKKFCEHLISIVDELGIRNNCFSDRTWGDSESNVLFSMLEKIQS